MYVCMCVCIYIYMYICTYIHIYTNIHIHTHTLTHTHIPQYKEDYFDIREKVNCHHSYSISVQYLASVILLTCT